MLSEKRIIDALVQAKTRGVIVKVILEPNPYGNPYINKKTYATLQKANIVVVWADATKYTYTHAKFFLIDGSFVIMTANMTHSAFVTNREFFIRGSDSNIFIVLQKIFSADFDHEAISLSNQNLVISPIDSRKKLESLLSTAQKTILLYSETFDDKSILQILENKSSSGTKINVILADPKKVSSNQKTIDFLKSIGVQVFTPKKPIIHAKALIIDGSFAYIGSENFTKNSLENNREVGILTRDKKVVNQLLQLAKSDEK